MKTRTILLTTLLLAPLLFVLNSTPTASALGTSTLQEQDIAAQINVTSANPIRDTSTSVTIPTTGDYLLTSGTSSQNGALTIDLKSGATTYFSIAQTGVITNTQPGTPITLITATNLSLSSTIMVFTVRIQNLPSGTYTLTCPNNAGSGGCQSGYTYPPFIIPNGLSAPTNIDSLMGYVGHFDCPAATCGVTEVQALIYRDPPTTLLSESTILNTERDNTALSSSLINAPLSIANGTGVSSDITYLEVGQSFTPIDTLGKYLARSAWRDDPPGSTSCTGTMSVSVANTRQHPWSNTIELANITATFTRNAGSLGAQTFVADWINGTLTNAASGITFGTPVLSIGGTIVTTTANLPPLISTTISSTYFLRAVVYSTTCTTANFLPMTGTTASTYAGGDMWRNDGTGWTEIPTSDLRSIDLTAYGGTNLLFNLTTNAQNVGGAIYTTLEVDKKDTCTCQAVVPHTTTFGSGVQGAGVINVNTPLVNTFEWRIGYLPIPYTSTQTIQIQIDTTGIGRNLLYSVTFPNSITHPDLGNLTFAGQTGNLQANQLFSTDDFNSTLYVTVHACQNGPDNNGQCTDPDPTHTPTISNGSWTANIVSTTTRIIGGSWNSVGNFSFSGQDVQGSYIALNLHATGYTNLYAPFTLPNTAGNYFLNLTMIPQGSFSITPTGVILTWAATNNNTRITPDTVSLNVTRSLHVPVYLDTVRFIGGTFVPAIQSPIFWDTNQNDTITVVFPTLARPTSAGDAGTYLYYGTNLTGSMLTTTQTYCVYAAGTTTNTPWSTPSVPCAVSLTTSDLNSIANLTTNRIGGLNQAVQANTLTQQRASAEAALVPFLLGWLTPLDATSTSGGTWWLTPATILVLTSWTLLVVVSIAAGGLNRGSLSQFSRSFRRR